MERRAIDFHSWDEVLSDVRGLERSGYKLVGDWHLGQVCDHLTISMTSTMDGFDSQLPWLVRRILGPMFFKKTMRTRSIKAGYKAPPQFIPSPDVEDHHSVETFKQVVERYQSFSGPYPEHPAFGRLDSEQWRDFHLIHASHHLSFLVPKQ